MATTNQTMPAIEFRDVSVSFDETPALTNVSFQLARGEMIFITGSSGSGKSVLLRLAVGLLTKGFAVASEESDKRSWRTLPDEIHLARVWVPPGSYRVAAQESATAATAKSLALRAGDTAVVIQRIVQ